MASISMLVHGKFLLKCPLLPDHTLLDKLYPLDDINNDLCIINGHYLHIISPINMCAEEPALII